MAGGLFLCFLLGMGISIGRRLGWFCFLHPILCIKTLFEKNVSTKGDARGTYSPVRALTVALAGTLGVGNITGVAAAIALGGAGALFWMWVSALLMMLIKYTEVALAFSTREAVRDHPGKTEYHGGPYRYLRHLRGGETLAFLFSVLCIAASFVQGNLLQMDAAVACATELIGIPLLPTVLLLSVGAGIFIFGGRARIGAFTERMIPFMTCTYVILCAVILLRNATLLPGILGQIVTDAFSVRALGGGGISVLLAMRHGCAKGIFSHEAGCGTSPISHAGAETDSPHRQGLLGIAEVFVDTIVLCTLTGFVLLVSGFGYGAAAGDFARAVLNAFGLWYGDIGRWMIGVSIVFYAFSTLVCWSFYGTECIRAVSARHTHTRQFIYRVSYLLCTLFGAFLGGDVLWTLSDILTAAMTVLNTTAVAVILSKTKEPFHRTSAPPVSSPSRIPHTIP